MTNPAPLVSGVDFVHLGTKDFEAAVQSTGRCSACHVRVATDSTLAPSLRRATSRCR